MKFSSLLSILASAAAARAVDPVTEYAILDELCNTSGPDTYVGVLYEGGLTTTFVFGQCYPYSIDGALAVMAVFCKSVTCYSNPYPDCTGGAVPPVGVPLPAGATLVNAADFVQILGQGATCEPNDIPV